MTRTIASLDPKLQFVEFQADAVKRFLGTIAEPYTAFFVMTHAGEYTEIWGIVGSIPYLSKLATRLYPADPETR